MKDNTPKLFYLIGLFSKTIFCHNTIRENEISKTHISRLRKEVFRSFIISLFSILTGLFLGAIVNYLSFQIPSSRLIIIQIIGAFFLLWGSIFRKMSTWGGDAIIDHLNIKFNHSLFFIGSTLISFSLYIIISNR